MNAPLGRCYWAVAPFSPEPPFNLFAKGSDPIPVDSARRLVEASRGGSSAFKIITDVKVRPVLVISEVLEPYNEVLALRLHRLEKLPDDRAREAVRKHEEEKLFYLDPAEFDGLDVENAAMVSALVKLPVSALDTSVELGQLNTNELRVIHERVARTHGLRLEMQVIERARELLARGSSR